eukprot:6181313-Pleurochrysis_carterae.AAC.1
MRGAAAVRAHLRRPQPAPHPRLLPPVRLPRRVALPRARDAPAPRTLRVHLHEPRTHLRRFCDAVAMVAPSALGEARVHRILYRGGGVFSLDTSFTRGHLASSLFASDARGRISAARRGAQHTLGTGGQLCERSHTLFLGVLEVMSGTSCCSFFELLASAIKQLTSSRIH